MKKKILTVIIGGVMIITCLFGCGKSDPKTVAKDKDVITTEKKTEDDTPIETTSSVTKEIEERLLDKYWYLCTDTELHMRIEFYENGTCDILEFTKSTSEEGRVQWEYDKAEESLHIYFEEHIYLLYKADEDCFQCIDPYNLEDEEYQEYIADWKMVYCNKRFNILDEEAYNCLHSILHGEGDYTDEFDSLINPIEESRIQKDKYTIDELHHAIEMAFIYHFENIEVNPNPVKVNVNGEIPVAQLFDTSNSEGRDLVKEVEAYLGTDTISFSSNMSKDCTMQIVEWDAFRGELVIQVISECCDLEFYILQDGDIYDGIYR